MLGISRHAQHRDLRVAARSTSDDLYCEWAPNEKVATEVAYGASLAGVRSLCAMKHVGLNVAADPIFTAAYNGVGGGIVIVVADDPEHALLPE